MFYYIKIRKKGNLSWKAVREDGRILVFNNLQAAKARAKESADSICNIIAFQDHPSGKGNPIYHKKYLKKDW